ncbi:MAG: VOC family protein [Thermomicrobiales bacterium]
MDVYQIAQRATDLDRASAFYTRLLGEPPIATFEPPGLVFFRVGTLRLLLDRNALRALLYLQVDDVRVRIEELRNQGVRIENEPHVIFSHEDDRLGQARTDEWQAFIRDSEDNLVG